MRSFLVRVLSRVLLRVLLRAAVVATSAACAPALVPANGAGAAAIALDEKCAIEPEAFVTADVGDIPLVLTSTHAGDSAPLGCSPGDGVLRAIEERVCEPEDDDVCASGPCRSGGPDGSARLLTFATLEALQDCLGGRPHLVIAETRRSIVDMNRDAHDAGGMRCALDDEAALPYWESFHRVVERSVGTATRQAQVQGVHAILVDLHTYQSLPAAPPPAIMIGTGIPSGTTVPALRRDDPRLDALFHPITGLRARLLANLKEVAENATDGDNEFAVHPTSPEASLEGLFAGRYMVHRYARVMSDETSNAGPAIDAIQIEVSSGLREDGLAAAQGIAQAICSALGPRVGAPGAAGPRR